MYVGHNGTIMDRITPTKGATIELNEAVGLPEDGPVSDRPISRKAKASLDEKQSNCVIELIARGEDDLISRILSYAKERQYVKYTSTLREAWRLSIHDLSTTIIDTFLQSDKELELHPDEDYTNDAVSRFGILEAQRHRERGVSLSMFLGLLKYYRQSYCDFISDSDLDVVVKREAAHRVDRIFDRIEIGLAAEWVNLSADRYRIDLEDTNRRLTNEKNQYLTTIESLATPILFLDRNLNTVLINQAANRLFSLSVVPGSYYYRQKLVEVTLPIALKTKVVSFEQSDSAETVFEFEHELEENAQTYQVYIKRMLDISDKFAGLVLIFNDITSLVKAERALEEREKRYRYITESMSDYVYTLAIDEMGNPTTEWIAGAFTVITGYTIHEIHKMERGYLSLIVPPDVDVYPLTQRDNERNNPYSVEYRIHNKNDEERWLRDHIKLLKDDSNRVVKLFGAVQDITEQKRAEAEIKSLKGILPICASCKKIRNDAGYWQLVEVYIHEHSEAEFSHGLCPECLDALYSDAEELGTGYRRKDDTSHK